MKARSLLIALPVILLSACHLNNDPNKVAVQGDSKSVSGLKVKKISLSELERKEGEIFAQFSFVDYPSGECRHIRYEHNTDANTIMLSKNMGIRLQDSCYIETKSGENVFHMTRRYRFVNKNLEENLNGTISEEPQLLSEDTFSYTITSRNVDSIYILQPAPTACNPIPLCYYHLMDIMWNPDLNNHLKVMIVTEWNGLRMDGSSVDTTIIHHMEVDDTGIATLNDNMFAGMPDEAFVNIWLTRESIETIYYDENPVTWQQAIEIVESNPQELYVLIHDNPEYLHILHSTYVVYGAIAHLPIYLIRNTKEEVPERKNL